MHWYNDVSHFTEKSNEALLSRPFHIFYFVKDIESQIIRLLQSYEMLMMYRKYSTYNREYYRSAVTFNCFLKIVTQSRICRFCRNKVEYIKGWQALIIFLLCLPNNSKNGKWYSRQSQIKVISKMQNSTTFLVAEDAFDWRMLESIGKLKTPNEFLMLYKKVSN